MNNRMQWNYAKYGSVFSLLLFICTTSLYMSYNKSLSYEFLLRTKVSLLPIGILGLLVSIFVGAITGYSIGRSTKKRMDFLHSTLLEMNRGKAHPITPSAIKDDFSEMEHEIILLAKKIDEQALAFQKITTERVTENAEALENAISQERHRLSRELHDSVSQQLFATSMMISAINEQEDIEQFPYKKQLSLIEDMVVNAQSEMRALLLHLRPVQLEGKPLHQGIKDLLSELSQKQALQMNWYVEELELNKGIEDHLFRIIQEALSNTLRHAKAKSIEVRLRKIEKVIILKIMDDGIGFDLNNRKSGSYGLQSMQERTTEIGGTFKIITLPSKGTHIEIKIPVKEEVK